MQHQALRQLRHNLTLCEVSLGSVVLTGLTSDLTPFGSTRKELLAVFLILLTTLLILKRRSTPTLESESEKRLPKTPFFWSINLVALAVLTFGSVNAVFATLRGGSGGGFASIAAEDNAAWIFILKNWFHEPSLQSPFGDSLTLILFLSTTVSYGLSLGRVGVGSVGDLVLQINIVYALVHILSGVMLLASARRISRNVERQDVITICALASLIVQQLWILDGRSFGHFSAIMASQVCLYFLLSFISRTSLSGSESVLLLCFIAGSTTLWLPLKALTGPLLLVVVVYIVWKVARRWSDFTQVGRVLFVIIGLMLLAILLRSLTARVSNFAEDASELVGASGGTNSPSEIELIILAGISALAIITAKRWQVKFVLVCLLSIALCAHVYALILTGGPSYASEKIRWWVYGTSLPLSLLISSQSLSFRTSSLSRVRENADRAVVVVVFSLIAVVAYPFAIVERAVRFPVHEWVTTDYPNESDRWWGVSEVVLESPVDRGPIGCVSVDTEFIMTASWDGYLCTRFVAWATTWSQKGVDPESPLRALGLGEMTQTAAFARTIKATPENLSRDVVLLDQGRLLGKTRLLDVLRLQDSESLRVEWKRGEFTPTMNLAYGHLDSINLSNGQLSGWVNPSVQAIELIGGGVGIPRVERTARQDVVASFGWSFAMSGFEIVIPPSEAKKLLCIVAVTTSGQKDLLWAQDARSCG